MPSSVELCAGAGGMALGLHRAGIHARALVEYNADACATLRAEVAAGRLSGDVLEESAATVDLTPYAGVDLLCAGWPCQPFSTAGLQRGDEDPRDGWPWITRALDILRPPYFLGENVSGLLQRKFDPYRRAMAADLSALGYAFEIRLLNAANYGVPQTRRRIILLAWRHGCTPWRHPVPTHHDPARGRSLFGSTKPWVTAGAAVGWAGMEMIGGNPSEREYAGEGNPNRGCSWTDGPAQTITTSSGSPKCRWNRVVPAWFRKKPEWRTKPSTLDHPARTVVASHGCGFENLIDLGVRGHTPAAVEGAVGAFLDAPALTVNTGSRPGVPGHHDPTVPGSQNAIWRAPQQWRAAWQTFPPDWRWQGSQGAVDRQIGNAVPPLLAEHIGETFPLDAEPTP